MRTELLAIVLDELALHVRIDDGNRPAETIEYWSGLLHQHRRRARWRWVGDALNHGVSDSQVKSKYTVDILSAHAELVTFA